MLAIPNEEIYLVSRKTTRQIKTYVHHISLSSNYYFTKYIGRKSSSDEQSNKRIVPGYNTSIMILIMKIRRIPRVPGLKYANLVRFLGLLIGQRF